MTDFETNHEEAACSQFYWQFLRDHRDLRLPPLDAVVLARAVWNASRDWHREQNEREIEAAAERLRRAIGKGKG